jgi:hypothetical protein
MAQKEYSDYQKSVIANYSSNLDTIMLQKLGEMVSELYLADSPKKKDKLWERVQKAMTNLKIPQPAINHIMAKKDVQILARNLNDWLKKK